MKSKIVYILAVCMCFLFSNCSVQTQKVQQKKAAPEKQEQTKAIPTELDKYLGEYANEETGMRFRFTQKNGLLNAQVVGDGQIAEFKKVGEHSFEGIGFMGLLTFIEDEDGNLNNMEVVLSDKSAKAKRVTQKIHPSEY